jgi:4-carboxymuconolactone decarboxylase
MAEGTPTASAQTPQTPIQKRFGSFAPKMADLTDNVLFGDVWERPQLSKRDRSLVTVSALGRFVSSGPVAFASRPRA